MPTFYYKSTCSTCRKARALLAELKVSAEESDMSRSPLSAPELDSLIGERTFTDFLNPRNEEYRERGYRLNPPSREEALERMAANANLVRRPILVMEDGRYLFGYDEARWREALGA